MFGTLNTASLTLLLCFGAEIGCIRLGSDFSRGGATLGEESREDWLDEGSEQDLGTTSLRQSQPEDEDELEGVVKCWDGVSSISQDDELEQHTEPVDGIDHALNDGQESIDDPVLEKDT